MVVSSRRPRMCDLQKSISRRVPQLKTVLVIAVTTLLVLPWAASFKRLATFFWKVVFLILVRALALFTDDGELLLDPLLFVDEPLFMQVTISVSWSITPFVFTSVESQLVVVT